MLAQNFKTPADLHITNAEFDAFLKVLGMLERGEVLHRPSPMALRNVPASGQIYFNMDCWSQPTECGTVCCLGGLAEMVGGFELSSLTRQHRPEIGALFYPPGWASNITTEQAAIALRNYLTDGEPRWAEALSA